MIDVKEKAEQKGLCGVDLYMAPTKTKRIMNRSFLCGYCAASASELREKQYQEPEHSNK